MAVQANKKGPTLSKTPRKTRSEVEHLRGTIRELQAENKSLKRQLRHYEKRENLYDNNKEEIEEILESQSESPIEASPKQKCEECARGVYEEFEILDKVYGTCTVCGARKRIR